jgi:cardiolipin synthase
LRSLFVNFEIGVLLYSASDVRAMKAWAVGLLAHCRQSRLLRPKKHRIIGNVAEELSRLLAPLL